MVTLIESILNINGEQAFESANIEVDGKVQQEY